MKIVAAITFTCALWGCGNSAQPARSIAPPPAQPAPAPATTEAAQRADALLADMARREAEYKKAETDVAERERLRQIPITPAASAPVQTPAAAAAPYAPVPVNAAAPMASAGDGRDEAWWKNEMRSAEVRLSDNQRRLQESRAEMGRALRQMEVAVDAGSIVFAQAQEAYNRVRAEVARLEGEVRNDSASVERVREDARRANVPPGWLRWP